MDVVTCDVLVVGSGAAGFATALIASVDGLDAIITEKKAFFGGTTTCSAGVIWIPGNSHARKQGIEDSVNLALEYLRQQVVRFSPISWPYYKPQLNGGLPDGRSLRPLDYDGRCLGTWFNSLRPPIGTMMAFGGMMVGPDDLNHLYNATRSPRSMLHAARMIGRYAIDRISSEEPDWRDQMKAAANGKPIRAVLDPVGGDIATNMIALLAGGGTLISYGDLSGLPIRVPALSFSVRDIRIHGVSVGRWAGLHESVRTEDIRTAIELARHEPALFAVAACYGLADIRRAAEHAQQAGKRGTVLLTSPSN
jgi:hypothetical protein